MQGIKISLDTGQYNSKPDANEVAYISKRIGASATIVSHDNIKQYATEIGIKGRTFCPATFNGTRSNNNFEQMQLLVLDFDGELSFQEVQNRSEQYSLPMLFAYNTFTSVNNDRFRIAYLNDTPLPNKKSAEIHLSALATIFPEVDDCSKKVSQMYYGGNKKELLHFDDSIPEINTESLIRNMTIYLKDKYGETHYKRKIKEFARTHGIALNKRNLLDVSLVSTSTEQAGACDSVNNNGKFLPRSIILNKPTDGKKLPNISYVINLTTDCTSNTSVEGAMGTKAPRQRTPYRQSDLNDIHDCCQLFVDFMSGDRKLEHAELFGIATNLINVESGTQYFRDILTVHPSFYASKHKYWDANLRYMNQQKYKPMSCSNYCPYKDTCQHSANILTTVKPRANTMARVAGYTEIFYSIEEVEADVDEKIRAAIDANDKRVHVVKAQTAVGKTRTYLEFMKTTTARCLIAVPTNVLKDDVYDRAVAEGIEVFKTSSLDDEYVKANTPKDVRHTIDYLYKTGQHQLIDSYISKVAEQRGIKCLLNHLKEKKKFETYGGHVITTHRKLLNMDEKTLKKYDVIIIDEDIILKSIIPNQISITASDLRKLSKTMVKEFTRGTITPLMFKQSFHKTQEALKAIESKTLFTLDSFEWAAKTDLDKMKKNPTAGTPTQIDVPAFCLAEHFYFRKTSEERNLKEDEIVFLKPSRLKKGFKYIMVTATANEAICKYYFGEKNVKFYDCKKARYKGTLTQFYNKSMSRDCIHKNPGILEKIKKDTGYIPTITFKEFAEDGDLYFGNAEGIDYLKGMDINVVGTNYLAEFLYKLFPYSIGLDFDEDAKPKINLLVTHNGYRFRFTTYEDKVLQDFQFWMLESDIEQAIGRARLLREFCTVNLYSSFPTEQAVMAEYDYDRDVKMVS